MALDVGDLTRKYIKLRDMKTALSQKQKEEMRKITEPMEKIEAIFLKWFAETGQESSRTPFGTPYTKLREKIKCRDREQFLQYIRDEEAWDMLDARPLQSALLEYMKEHGELPPGLDYEAEKVVNVNSPRKK